MEILNRTERNVTHLERKGKSERDDEEEWMKCSSSPSRKDVAEVDFFFFLLEEKEGHEGDDEGAESNLLSNSPSLCCVRYSERKEQGT